MELHGAVAVNILDRLKILRQSSCDFRGQFSAHFLSIGNLAGEFRYARKSFTAENHQTKFSYSIAVHRSMATDAGYRKIAMSSAQFSERITISVCPTREDRLC
jgi:hypothetical protein